jgi:hypothetical protein
MNRPGKHTGIFALFLFVSLAFVSGAAFAQGAKQLVGTWSIVSGSVFDPNPRGLLIFTADGYYSLTLAKTTLPKFASNSRDKGTPGENQAVVGGSISHFGKYTVDEKDKSFTINIQTSTFPNWDNTSQKRPFTISGDTLKYVNPAPSSGGSSIELVWKRLK